MNTSISSPINFRRLPVSLIVSAVLVSACSGSGSEDSVPSAVSDVTIANTPVDNGVSQVANDPVSNVVDTATGASGNESQSESVAVVSEPSAPNAVTDNSTDSTSNNSNTVVNQGSGSPEPLLTNVDFDITVPVYVSNSLQVQLLWGDTQLFAGWVVDETWSVSAEFASDTENPLIVNFLDRNGAVVLASYTTSYQTGTGASETFEIGADQFDTSAWDTDGDGVSNFDESIAGTNPLAAPDPSIQNLVRVDFGVTVPVYVSDALQVRFVWGDEEIEASWVGDEFWSAFADLPVDTEEPLSVTFYDRNGDIAIASYETTYETGNNGAEYFQVESHQFNTNRFDTDLDGVSNINELVAETDPLVADSSVPVTFTSIKERFGRCGDCHQSFRGPNTLYDNLTSLSSRNDNKYVVPFEPEESYLVSKLDGSMRNFGSRLLPGLVRAWVAKGALDN